MFSGLTKKPNTVFQDEDDAEPFTPESLDSRYLSEPDWGLCGNVDARERKVESPALGGVG